MLQILLAGVLLSALFYYYAIKPMTYWKERGVKQKRKVWFLGDNWRNMLRLESFADMTYRVYNEFPDVRYSGFYQFTVPTLVIKDPELLKQIGVKDFDHFTDHRSFFPEDADPLWGKNLFALKGQRWRDMRPILSPSFTSSKMKAIFVLISECSKNFSNYFLNKHQNIVEVEMKDIFTRFTNDVIATTAFGIKTNSLENQTNEFYMMGKEITDFSSFLKLIKLFGYLLVPKLYDIFKITLFDKRNSEFFINLIDNTLKTRRENGIVRPDMIQLLMQAQSNAHHREENEIIDNGFATLEEHDLEKSTQRELTNMDIAAQAMIFFFAGFDTVSTAMCFMGYELAVNPDVQKRLREEIEETLNECNGTLTYEALIKMKYMDMVLTETLRKWPGAVAVDRVCTKPYTIQPVLPEEKPISLNVGDVIWFPVFGIHRDPEIYPEPELFNPERFSDENKHNINLYTYLPFGVGPRNCIGNRFALLEIKTIMFHILSQFEIMPTAKTQIPLKISKKHVNLHAKHGFWFGLKRLDK